MARGDTPSLTNREAEQIERANASSATPVVFVHGLWLLPTSWERWAELFERHGFVALAPGWPGDPDTGEQADEHAEAVADTSVCEVADHFEAVISRLTRKPVIVGH